MGLFRNLTDSFGLTRRETLDIDVAGAFNPIEFVNDIMGVSGKREEFTRADGTKGVRFVATGATPEQNEFITSLTEDIQSLVGDITELSQIGVAINNDAFDPVIQSVRENQKDAREQAFKNTSRMQEEVLARRGLEDSTAAIENRAQLGSEFAKAEITDERNLVLLAEQLRDQQIQRSGIGLQTSQGERGALSNVAESQRAGSLNLATGQQQLSIGAQTAMQQDRIAADQQQAGAFIDTAFKVATGGFGGGGGGFATSPMQTFSGGQFGGGFSNTSGGQINWFPQ